MKKIKNFDNFIIEHIHPKEAYTSLGSIKTLLDGRRKLCYNVKADLNDPEFKKVFLELLDNGFLMLKVKGKHNPFVVYHPSKEKEAKEIKDLAEHFDGYLHANAPLRIQKRFGEILEYDPVEIEAYINRRKESGIPE